MIEHTGQSHLPAIELEDGRWYREQSAEMATAIRAGKFGAPPAADRGGRRRYNAPEEGP